MRQFELGSAWASAALFLPFYVLRRTYFRSFTLSQRYDQTKPDPAYLMATASLLDSPKKSSSLWKGKAKEVAPAQDEFGDLNPTITYKQLLSQSLGVRDPLRVVALCDSDAFYAACDMVRLGVDIDTPLVVLQWDSLIAVNYPARKYGISRMDKKKDALKRCPHLKVVHVATYKEGEAEPGYWEDVDTNTHKVNTLRWAAVAEGLTKPGFSRLLSQGELKDCSHVSGDASGVRSW